ncbi:MAG: hypothetical protein M1831_004020 [Alyxoria varia]|nr:MAG: hypothetical protein M1831_004020 [Alyxoria varia]
MLLDERLLPATYRYDQSNFQRDHWQLAPEKKSGDVLETDCDDFDIPDEQAGQDLILAEAQENPLATNSSYGQPQPYNHQDDEHGGLLEEIEAHDEEKKTRPSLEIPRDILSGFDEFIRYEGREWVARYKANMLLNADIEARRRSYQHQAGNTKKWNELFREFLIIAPTPPAEQKSSITLAGLHAQIEELSLALSDFSIPCSVPTRFEDGCFLKIFGSRLFVLAVLHALNASQDFFVAHMSLTAEKAMAARVLYVDTFDMLQTLEKRREANLILEEEQEGSAESNDQREIPIEIRIHNTTKSAHEPRFHPRYKSTPEIALELASFVQDMSGHPELASKNGVDTVISFFVKLGRIFLARTIMSQMNDLGVSPDQTTYNHFLQVASSEHNLDAFSTMVGDMIEAGLQPNFRTWNNLLHAAPETAQKRHVVREMHRRAVFTSTRAAFHVAPRIIDFSLETFLDSGGSISDYIDTLTQLFGPTWLSQRALGRFASVLVRTLRYREAVYFIDYFASTGIYSPRVEIYNIMLRQCDDQKNLLCAVTLAMHALRKHATTVTPDRVFFNRLFLIAWRSRRLNCVRIVWKYACAAGHMSGFMVRKFLASLRCANQVVAPVSEEQRWQSVAAVFIRGGHVRGLTDLREHEVRRWKREGLDFEDRDLLDEGETEETESAGVVDDTELEGDGLEAHVLAEELADREYGQHQLPGHSGSGPTPRTRVEIETLITAALHEEQEIYGTYEELRPFDQALEEALRLDYSQEWERKVQRGLPELDWLLRNTVEIPMRSKRMRVARGMLERYRALVEH